MATSLLRLGRLGSLKCLQVDSWGVLKTRTAASFCTQAEEPAKPVKKAKPASRTDVQDERATLLAYKTTVAFPVRLSEPGVFPIQSAGVTDPVASPTATAEAVVAAEATASVIAASGPAIAAPEAAGASAPDPDVAQVIADTAPPVVDAAPPAAEPLVEASSKTSAPDNTAVAASVIDNAVPDTASSEPGDPAPDGSSSSSSSDSSSDSDSEDENEKAESRVKEKAEVQEVTSEVKEDTKESKKEATNTPAAEAVEEAAATAQATLEAPSVSSEELVDSAPDICTATEDTPEGTVTSSEVSAEHVIQDVVPPAIPDDEVGTQPEIVTMCKIPVETSDPASAATPSEVAVEPVEAGAASVESSIKGAEVVTVEAAEAPAEAAEAARAEMAAEAVAEASALVESAKKLMDPSPVKAEAAGEELQTEAPAELSEESAAAAPPEPEEHFDNSTYKNYQHHNYNPYTFADLDVEMAKFRLPQPSSIRH